MPTHDSMLSDRKFFALLAIIVAATLAGLHFWATHLRASKPDPVKRAPKNVLHLEAIEHVYECDRDGKRVLTDRPCGTGVPIRVIESADKN